MFSFISLEMTHTYTLFFDILEMIIDYIFIYFSSKNNKPIWLNNM